MDMSLDEIIAKAGPGKGGGAGKARPITGARVARRPTPYGGGRPSAKGAGRAVQGGAGRAAGGASVYVGNLSWEVTWQDLKDHFKTVGNVLHADVMYEPGTTRSKGCGVVTFANGRDAQAAIQQLHDTDLKGRLIFVREDREAGAGGGGGRVLPASPAKMATAADGGSAGCKVYVGNLARATTWQELKDLFREAGTVTRADVAQGPDGTSKGWGTVLLGSTREAAKAIQLFNEYAWNGRVLQVRPDAMG